MPVIPLATFYARKTGFLTAKPPLMDLAWINLTHWRSSSEQRHCLAIGRRPFPAFLGFDEEELTSANIGPHSGVRSTKSDASVMIVEPTGAAIESGRQDLQDLKEEMATFGPALLIRKPVQKTATEATNEKQDSDSDLGTMAVGMEDAMNTALKFTAMWSGKDKGGTVEVNKKFPAISLSREQLDALIKASERGWLSRVALLQSFISDGTLPADFNIEEDQVIAAAEAQI